MHSRYLVVIEHSTGFLQELYSPHPPNIGMFAGKYVILIDTATNTIIDEAYLS